MLAHTDIVLYDVKHMDTHAHMRYTGQGNERILENLARISRRTDCALIIRCPVIPPCNDSPENFHALGRFLTEKAIRCSEIDLLPYHNLGTGKLEQLEPDTEGFLGRVPDQAEMEALREILRGYGLPVR